VGDGNTAERLRGASRKALTGLSIARGRFTRITVEDKRLFAEETPKLLDEIDRLRALVKTLEEPARG